MERAKLLERLNDIHADNYMDKKQRQQTAYKTHICLCIKETILLIDILYKLKVNESAA